MNIKILIWIILLCIITTIANVMIHSQIINDSKAIRTSCINYVHDRCACNPPAMIEYEKLNLNITQWKPK